MEQLIFGILENQRYTQDSPVLPEVWIKYALHPHKTRDLILVPDRSSNAGAFAHELNRRLKAYRENLPKPLAGVRLRDSRHKPARIAHLPGVVAARLYFDEFLRLVLPSTPWWRKMVVDYRERLLKLKLHSPYLAFGNPKERFSLHDAETSGPSLVEALARAMVTIETLAQSSINATRDYSRPRAGFVQTARIAGAVATLFLGESLPKVENGRFRPGHRREMTKVGGKQGATDENGHGKREEPFRVAYDHIAIARNFLTLFEGWPGPQCGRGGDDQATSEGNVSAPPPSQIFRVSINRDVVNAVNQSSLACKADAARLLFNVDCKNIIWAIADSGIDAHHPAFFDWRGDSGRSRVLKTYDFRELRESLSLDQFNLDDDEQDLEEQEGAGQKDGHQDRGEASPEDRRRKKRRDLLERVRAGVLAEIPEAEEGELTADELKRFVRERVAERIEELKTRLKRGADVDWALLEPLVAVDEKFIDPPTVDHGAHVAGILAADWPINPETDEPVRPEQVYRRDKDDLAKREVGGGGRRAYDRCVELSRGMADAIENDEAVRPAAVRQPRDKPDIKPITPSDRRHMTGMCPDIRLFDFRVLRDDGQSDEFEVIAALQFIRFLNARAGATLVHGVNLSLSIKHDVANYACGATPVCEECDQLTANGAVVVAAAGNFGHNERGLGLAGMQGGGYNAISITDPGNAEGVITVGATHRSKPHVYGPSYFSSRGPTGDGRMKPDLVAPGEKIIAPVGFDDWAEKDGSSMAAPHVSGAAAILMARHGELVGQPAKIKKILCETATDLGRERYFQGAGMLDTLRALQSV